MQISTTDKKRVAVLIGTGFHRWVLGAGVSSPLCDWATLLRNVSATLGVAAPELASDQLALSWETLLLRMVSDGYQRPDSTTKPETKVWVTAGTVAVHKAETDARKVVYELLNKATEGFPAQSLRARIFLDLPVSDVISLNFDASWIYKTTMTGKQKSVIEEDVCTNKTSNRCTKVERERLYFSLSICGGPRVWFPNGHLESGGKSIRLGARDFGFQSQALAVAFNRFKAWEKSILSSRNDVIDSAKHALLIEALSKPDKPAFSNADHWVRPFMLRPLFILGAGLSPDEQGLWWLLVQRARNRARINQASNVYVLLNRSSSTNAQIAFWSQCPLGITPLWCDNWDAGWRLASQMIKQMGEHENAEPLKTRILGFWSNGT